MIHVFHRWKRLYNSSFCSWIYYTSYVFDLRQASLERTINVSTRKRNLLQFILFQTCWCWKFSRHTQNILIYSQQKQVLYVVGSSVRVGQTFLRLHSWPPYKSTNWSLYSFISSISHQAPTVLGFSAWLWHTTISGGSHRPQICRICHWYAPRITSPWNTGPRYIPRDQQFLPNDTIRGWYGTSLG